MKIETHENKYVKQCLNCESEVTSMNEEHLFCTQCGFPIRNECTGTSKFNSGYGNEPLTHEEDEYPLEPTDAFCPKCSAESLFNQRGLIEVKYPRVEIINPPVSSGGEPFY
ncbi:hypothetical protein [Viridibacillus arvi]|uniref:hypothetical protein n=1 Tax=Viridibacillus arvi TaxID=263475 RepID=UPI00187BB899|nr:hypothetical protein [Viridibacillus sp. JNUCC-6]QOV10914.1 hypothetical protein JNUCC6_20480 [Viridibacillus sp. JNUCC-6]